ncbi:hypothetical protein [Luteimonas kalidii]|uniref:Outer membrane protein beta-barrel domain-containing protein n=1 Tax=Luteimonas kalidii TaxID=3042025 RepID=A0ABT6JSW8_9GAMM|nr:hypothetical protein [Luteimonas kalidii]MDH5833565.1 hypothetical protein [Luteimonas kalidii]
MDGSRRSRMQRAAFALAGLAASAAAPAEEGQGWDWMVEPYAWAASIGTDLRTITPPTDADNETSFSDILDKLDGVFMVRVEGRNDDYGMFADFIYLGLAQGKQRRVLSTESDLDTRLLDAAFSFRLSEDRDAGLDVYAGIRYIDVDLATRFTPDNPVFQPRTLDVGNTYVDLLLGARYAWRLSDRWGLTLRGDASVGDTDGTWSTSVMAHYRTRHGAWLLGYRYLDAEFGNGNVDVDLNLSGPLVGYGFRF